MNFILTKWHEENPNDWCAIKPGRMGRKPVLIDRDKSLMTLSMRIGERKVVYCRAWGMGISKDYPICKTTTSK